MLLRCSGEGIHAWGLSKKTSDCRSAVLASLAAGESALAPVEDAATAPAATVPQRRRKARTQGHEQQGK
jgi:hypothetical protein